MRIETKARKAFNVCNIIILSILGICFVVPYLMIVSASFTSTKMFNLHGYSVLPRGITFSAYISIFRDGETILRAIGNSLFYTVVGTCLHVSVNIMAAYPLSKRDFVGKGVVMRILVFAMLFSGGLIPTYVLISEMHLKNTWWALLLPGALAPWNVIMIRSYYLTIPLSLDEAAKLDGASNFTVFARIYVPMSMPIISTQILFTAVGFWNAWSGPLLYFDSAHSYMYPLTTLLKLMLDESSGAMGGSGSGYTEPEKMATTVISTLPIIIAYPFMQRYFISGMTLGSVKE